MSFKLKLKLFRKKLGKKLKVCDAATVMIFCRAAMIFCRAAMIFCHAAMIFCRAAIIFCRAAIIIFLPSFFLKSL